MLKNLRVIKIIIALNYFENGVFKTVKKLRKITDKILKNITFLLNFFFKQWWNGFNISDMVDSFLKYLYCKILKFCSNQTFGWEKKILNKLNSI